MNKLNNRNMKKLLLLSFVVSSAFLFAQDRDDEDEKGGWKNNHLFIGSGINLGFSNGFIVGLNPEVGYSISKILDAGIAFNFTYVTQRSQQANYSLRYTAIGGGPFVRLWPARMFFVGAQFEYNSIGISEKFNSVVTKLESATAPSLLLGLGYGNRMIGQSQFYTSIMIDALNDPNSPYRDQFGRILPVFRTGFIFYLGRKNRED